MTVVGIVKMDSQGRIPLGSVISPLPKFVNFSIDTDYGGIFITPSDNESDCTIDAKYRAFVPAWLRKALPNGTREFLVVSINAQKMLVPSTHPIDWCKISLSALISL